MLLKIKKSDGIGYARKEDYEYEGTQYEADLKIGDKVKFIDSGNVEEGNYGMQNNFKIKTRNGEKKVSPNQSSINVLVEAWGGETENWVGKEANVLMKKTVIAGKKCIVAYFVVEGWYLDEYGELVCNVEGVQDTQSSKPVTEEDPNFVDANSIPF